MRTNIRYCTTHQKDKFLTVEGCPGCLAMLVDDNADLRAENARLREALEEIAGWYCSHAEGDEAIKDHDYGCPTCIARAALG